MKKLNHSGEQDQENKKLLNIEQLSDDQDFQSIETDKSELGQED